MEEDQVQLVPHNENLAGAIVGDLFTADEIVEEEEEIIMIMIDEMVVEDDEFDHLIAKKYLSNLMKGGNICVT